MFDYFGRQIEITKFRLAARWQEACLIPLGDVVVVGIAFGDMNPEY